LPSYYGFLIVLLKKSTFFFKGLLLQNIFFTFSSLCFFDALSSSFSFINSFKSFLEDLNIHLVSLSSSFVNFFFKNSIFFFFVKPFCLLLYGNSFLNFCVFFKESFLLTNPYLFPLAFSFNSSFFAFPFFFYSLDNLLHIFFSFSISFLVFFFRKFQFFLVFSSFC